MSAPDTVSGQRSKAEYWQHQCQLARAERDEQLAVLQLMFGAGLSANWETGFATNRQLDAMAKARAAIARATGVQS